MWEGRTLELKKLLCILFSLPFLFGVNAGVLSGPVGTSEKEIVPSFIGEFFGTAQATGCLADGSPQIVHVTNLNATGAGSLDSLIATSGNCIVFDVSGLITHTGSDRYDMNDNISVFGMTAPGAVVITNTKFQISSDDNVEIYHVSTCISDQFSIPGFGLANADNVTITSSQDTVIGYTDNCWSVDENINPYTGTDRFNYVKNAVFECLDDSINTSPHGFAILAGGSSGGPQIENFFMEGNLLANCTQRMPKFQGGIKGVFVNNLIYNAVPAGTLLTADGRGIMSIDKDGRTGDMDLSVTHNVMLSGPNTQGDARAINFRPDGAAVATSAVFLNENSLDGTKPATPALQFSTLSFTFNQWDAGLEKLVIEDAFPYPTGFTPRAESITEAYVLDNVGSRPADRIPMLARVISDLKDDTGAIIDAPSEVGNFPTFPERSVTWPEPSQGLSSIVGPNGMTPFHEALYQEHLLVTGHEGQSTVGVYGVIADNPLESTMTGGTPGDIIFVLNHGEWVSSFGATQQQQIIDACVATTTPTNGWNNEQRADETTSAVARTDRHQVTWNVSANAAYSITSDEEILCTIPSALIVGGNNGNNVQANYSLTIVNN